jgi:hypothetical protein
MWLEEWVSQNYDVYPVDARKQVEQFELNEGIKEVYATAFVVPLPTLDSDEAAVEKLKEMLTNAIPFRSIVQWRIRPRVDCFEDSTRVMRCRISCLSEPNGFPAAELDSLLALFDSYQHYSSPLSEEQKQKLYEAGKVIRDIRDELNQPIAKGSHND